MYKCAKCGEEFDDLPQGIIRCPNCAFRILFKAREPLTKKVKAR